MRISVFLVCRLSHCKIIANFATYKHNNNTYFNMSIIKQNFSRLLTVIALTLAFTIPATAQIVRGEKSLGPKLGYVSRNKSASAGLMFQYAFSEHFRVAPEVGYIFRNNDYDAFTFDINAHVPFDFTGDRVTFYPLCGLNYSSWSHHFRIPVEEQVTTIADSKDVSSRTARFGLNIGAGFDMRCSESLKLTLEAKYIIIKGYSTTAICAGISYIF